MICLKNFVLSLSCFCVFQYGYLPIVGLLLLVVPKSICLMLDDSRKDTDALSNSVWSISGTTCSTYWENLRVFIGDLAGKTEIVNGGMNCSLLASINSIDVV